MPEMPVRVRSRTGGVTFTRDQAMHRLEKQFPLPAQSVLYLVFIGFTFSFSHFILLGESSPALSDPIFLRCCTKNQQFLIAAQISGAMVLLNKCITQCLHRTRLLSQTLCYANEYL